MVAEYIFPYIAGIVCLILVIRYTKHWASISFPLCMLSGMLLGPHCISIFDRDVFVLASHYGLIVMLFAAGLKVNIRQFSSIACTAVWILIFEVICSLVFCSLCQMLFGFEWKMVLLWLFVCVLSSTVCALQIMEREDNGYNPYVMGVLIVQDMALPVMIILLKSIDNLMGNSVFGQIITKLGIGLAPLLVVLCIGYLIGDTKKFNVYDSWLYLAGMITWCIVFAGLFECYELSSEYGAFLAGLVFGVWWDAKKASFIVSDLVNGLSSVFFLFIGITANLRFIVEYAPTVFGLSLAMFFVKTFINVVGFNMITNDRMNMRSGILLATLSELSFSLISASGVRGFYTELIESCVIVCMLFSMTWYKKLIRHKRIW